MPGEDCFRVVFFFALCFLAAPFLPAERFAPLFDAAFLLLPDFFTPDFFELDFFEVDFFEVDFAAFFVFEPPFLAADFLLPAPDFVDFLPAFFVAMFFPSLCVDKYNEDTLPNRLDDVTNFNFRVRAAGAVRIILHVHQKRQHHSHEFFGRIIVHGMSGLCDHL